MTLNEREQELNSWFSTGEITQREWAKLWEEALDNLQTYPDK